MAKSYEIKDGKLIFLNTGVKFIDSEELKSISKDFTEIVFPECFRQIETDDFSQCKDQLAKVKKLDFSKSPDLYVADIKGASALRVVVLPKEQTELPNFEDCPQLEELHFYSLDGLGPITNDKDGRLSVFVSNLDIDDIKFHLKHFPEDKAFFDDVGFFYVPAGIVGGLKDLCKESKCDFYDIRPLPEGYVFPKEALSEPWLDLNESINSYDFEVDDSEAEEFDDDVEEETFSLDQIYGGIQYHCVLEGKSFGPVTLRQFANMARFHIVDKDTLVWKEGMSNWAAASTLPDLKAII